MSTFTGYDRRTALKLILAAAAAPALMQAGGLRAASPAGPTGTLTDPDLVNPVVPWKGVLSEQELNLLEQWVDRILPEDEHSPSAASIGAHHFINEWVSAPYDRMLGDRVTLRAGMAWLESAAEAAFGKPFAQLGDGDTAQLFERVCLASRAAPADSAGAAGFALVRNLAATAFYTTPEGMKDLGYVGNVPLDSWPPPPDEALEHVGLK